jgi:hypothetical protein
MRCIPAGGWYQAQGQRPLSVSAPGGIAAARVGRPAPGVLLDGEEGNPPREREREAAEQAMEEFLTTEAADERRHLCQIRSDTTTFGAGSLTARTAQKSNAGSVCSRQRR